MNAILMRGAFAAIGFWIATYFVGGLHFDDGTTLIFSGLVLGLINAFVRPLFIVLTLPITVVTLGLFLLVINAAMVGCVAWLLPGMHVAGFWSALGTSVIVSVVSWIGGALARA
jgi:putative membrane protein